MAENQHVGVAEGQGRLRLANNESPVTYQMKGEAENDARYRIAISVSAPRDWLIDNGFERTVELVRANRETLQLTFDGNLDISDNLAVTLEAESGFSGSEADFIKAFPEFETVFAHPAR